ncbi:MAG: Hsp70 family protein [Rhodanobacteraceae bacterium]
MASDNRSLGRFILDGLLPAPRGVPQIEVAFDIDANGIVNVSAKDKATGKEQKITITAGGGLSKDEVERLQKEAELHASEDKKRRDDIEVRNQADSLAYTAEKTVRENGDKIEAGLKSEVEGKIAAVRSQLQSGDADSIRSAMEELSETMQRIGQAVYGAQQQPGADGSEPGEQPGGEGPAEEGTVEGEYREV